MFLIEAKVKANACSAVELILFITSLSSVSEIIFILFDFVNSLSI